MAQVVNVQPVVIQDDGSTQRFIAVLSNQIESRRRQEQAAEEARIRQIQDNYKVFGDRLNESANFFKSIDGVSADITNRIGEEYKKQLAERLSNNQSSPTYQLEVAALTSDLAKRRSDLSSFKPQFEEALKEIKALAPSVSEQNLMAAAMNYFYKQQQLPDGSVARDVNWANLPNMKNLLVGEFKSNPERYVDLASSKNSLFNTIEKIEGEEFTPTIKKDPDSKTTLAVSVKGKIKPFEQKIKKKEPTTGLEVEVPGIKFGDYTGLTNPYTGAPYKIVDEDVFTSIRTYGGASVDSDLQYSAIDFMNNHNQAAIFKYLRQNNPASVPDAQLLEEARSRAVGVNSENITKPFAQGGIGDVPGAVNKYKPSDYDIFKRLALTKMLSDTGRYNPDGTLKSADISPTVDKQRTTNVTNISIPKTETTINAFDSIANRMGGKTSNLKDVAYGAEMDPFIEFANQNGKRASLGLKYSSSDIQLVPNQNGTITVTSGQEQIGTMDKRTVDMMINKPLGQKAQQSVVEGTKRTGANSL